MSMQSKLTKTLLAMAAATTLLIAGPSQAGQPYCPYPAASHHGGYGHGHGHRYAPPIRKVVVVQHRHHRDHHRDWHGRRDWRDDRRRHDRHDHRWDNRRDDARYAHRDDDRDGYRDWRR